MQNGVVIGDRRVPGSILFVTNFGGIIAGADRALLNVLNELPPSIHVYLVGANETEKLLEHLPHKDHVSVLNVGYCAYPYTEGERQHSAPTGQALQKYLGYFFEMNFKALRELTQLLQGIEIDLVHSNTSVVILGALYAKCWGIRHLWHARESLIFGGEAQLFWTWLMSQLSDAIVVPSQAAAAGYGTKCHVIHDGFNVVDFLSTYSHLSTTDVTKKFNISDEEAVILSLGTISRTKGQAELVRAISHILSDSAASIRRQLRIFVIGYHPNTTYVQELKRLIGDCQLEDVITLTGLLPYDEAMALLKRADIVVQPSTLADSYPNTVIEAMLAGKSIIASRIGGIPEMVEDGQTGLLCKPSDSEDLANKIVTLLDNPTLAASLGENAARHSPDKFDIQRTIEELTQLYDKIMSAPPSPKSDKEYWQAILMEQVLRRDEELTSLKAVLQARDEELASVKAVLQARKQELNAIYSSKTWRIAKEGLRVYQLAEGVVKSLVGAHER